MVNFGPLAVSRLGSITALHSTSGCQANFAALNRGRFLYSAGRPSHWALAHILVVTVFQIFIYLFIYYEYRTKYTHTKHT